MFLATPVISDDPAAGDVEIERYFDMSVQVMERSAVLDSIGGAIIGTETITAFILAQRALAAS
jgi:hypothetical protein